MGSDPRLSEPDLIRLLKQKSHCLAQLIQWTQQQQGLTDATSLNQLFDKKSHCLEQLQELDEWIQQWSTQFARLLTPEEAAQAQQIAKQLKQLELESHGYQT